MFEQEDVWSYLGYISVHKGQSSRHSVMSAIYSKIETPNFQGAQAFNSIALDSHI